MKKISKLMLGLCLLLALHSGWAGSPSRMVMISDAWVQEAPPMAGVNAAYMVIENAAGQPKRLTGASSPVFERVEMHNTEIHDGMADMVRQASVEIPAHGRFEFRPGGYHFMLMKARHGVRAGDKVRLLLSFADGSQLGVDIEVRKAMGSMEHSQMDPSGHTAEGMQPSGAMEGGMPMPHNH